MPFELIGKVGLSSGILIVMCVLIWEWIKNNKVMHKENKAFVTEVLQKCDDREAKLIKQLDKYNNSLEKISQKLNVIPQLQDDIEEIKDVLKINQK